MLKVRDSNDDIKKIVFHVNPNFNLKLVCRAPLNRNPNMEVNKVAWRWTWWWTRWHGGGHGGRHGDGYGGGEVG